MKTVFEKIIDREIIEPIVYEDDVCISFPDKYPVKPGHLLLVSKKVYRWVEDVPANELGHMMNIAQNLIRDMKSTGADYVRVGIVGMEVPHFHIHLIPQKFTDEIVR